LAHQAATEYASETLSKSIGKLTAITVHLGSGASIAWFLQGKPQDTTMGFTPNEGLTMSTRAGDVPADAVFYLERKGIALEKLSKILTSESGLLGLFGSADLREVLIAAGHRVPGFSARKYNSDKKRLARLALKIYIYDIQRYLSSYIGMSKILDAIVFSGAVSENPLVRKLVLRGINIPRKTKILFRRGAENETIAKQTIKCLIK
jgi:acetate kinase